MNTTFKHGTGLVLFPLLLLIGLSGCSRKIAPPVAYNNETVQAIRNEIDIAGGGGGSVSLGDPTGWATFRGSFKINGTPPALSPLTVTRDRQVCSPGGRAPLSEEVVVGPGNGLANVLIFLEADIPLDDPNWIHPSYDESKEAEVIFDQKECIFLSHVFAMRSTQKMKILNSDPVGHNTNLSPNGRAAPFNEIIPVGQSAIYSPGGQSKSAFKVACTIHPWMNAWMITRDNPYFAVTKPDGSFEIPNVPAGIELEFRVWQEAAGYLSAVTVNGSDQKWSKGRFTITLENEAAENLDVVVDASAFK